jgi:trimeric autotransporter adhesin
MNPLIELKKANLPLLIVVVAICFAFLSVARAVDPPPDGGYPNRNTAEGDLALFNADVEAGNDNTAIGFSTLYSNFGSFNTAIGSQALFSNTGGIDNTASGSFALHNNTLGNENTATGSTALLRNTIGNANTATGIAALQSNTTGSFNTATGGVALASNTTGNSNTAIGDGALSDNTTGSFNTALGASALLDNTRGSNNTATGFSALQENTTGRTNTANGFEALLNNTTGNNNIALGFRAGFNLTTGSGNIDIGNGGVAAESSTIRIGSFQTRTFIAGISGVPVTGSQVVVNSNGKLGVVASSARFKDAIKPMDKASEAILALKPVTFRYKKEIDVERTPQFGLVAEDVEKVNPALVARDEQGKPYKSLKLSIPTEAALVSAMSRHALPHGGFLLHAGALTPL